MSEPRRGRDLGRPRGRRIRPRKVRSSTKTTTEFLSSVREKAKAVSVEEVQRRAKHSKLGNKDRQMTPLLRTNVFRNKGDFETLGREKSEERGKEAIAEESAEGLQKKKETAIPQPAA